MQQVPQTAVKKRGGRPNNRARLLSVAGELFMKSGFRDVSVDKISETADVTKQTVYYHFANKEQLVVEVLEERIDSVEASLAAAINARQSPRDRLKAIFDWHTDWFNQPDFSGCLFLRAASEYKGEQRDIAELTEVQKLGLRRAIKALLEAAGVSSARSENIARAFLCLLDGAVVSAQILGEKDAADNAWRSAETILDAESTATQANSSTT
ncbi:TetR/AcrR family transcriptional regulator [Gluconacetobacter sacchari]|uniref:TetR/AcrR family transcriptional regulator n=1 Tax=Gluconacetobacter sacchari TaxID=92759 RepID=UPI0039B491AC